MSFRISMAGIDFEEVDIDIDGIIQESEEIEGLREECSSIAELMSGEFEIPFEFDPFHDFYKQMNLSSPSSIRVYYFKIKRHSSPKKRKKRLRKKIEKMMGVIEYQGYLTNYMPSDIVPGLAVCEFTLEKIDE